MARDGNRQGYSIINQGNANIYLWMNNTVAANAVSDPTIHGYILAPGQSLEGELDPQDEVWGIVAALPVQPVHIAETRTIG